MLCVAISLGAGGPGSCLSIGWQSLLRYLSRHSSTLSPTYVMPSWPGSITGATNRSIMIHPQVSGLACQLCAATRGATRPVMCWRNAEKIVCLRHRRSIGITDSIQPSLDRQSDILEAHRQHLRLVRRFGRDNVTAAFTIAADICLRWHGQQEHDADLARRLEIFHGRGWRVPPNHPTVAAASYPQVVSLARILVSPYWRSLAIDSSSAGQSTLSREIRRTVAPAYLWPQPKRSKDPLHQWLIDDVQFAKTRRNSIYSTSTTDPWNDLPVTTPRYG